MEVEFTAKQGKITKTLRDKATLALDKMGRILGKTARASVTLGAQRQHQIIEITLQARSQTIAASGKGAKADIALHQALEHAELQVMRYRDRKIVAKRLPKEEKLLVAPPVSRTKSRAAQPEEPVAKPKKRSKAAAVVEAKVPGQPSLVQGGDAVAAKPMRIEEAVKDAESRDRDLLIFRTPGGDLHVLHRRRDGKMELVEVS